MKKAGTERGSTRSVRLSDRGAYVIEELLKVRRMTLGQVSRLLGLDEKKSGAYYALRRLESLDLVRREVVPLEGELVTLVRLTDEGGRRATESLGRVLSEHHRDDVQYHSHLLRGTELYLSVVRAGARDWMESRARARRFQWMASNDNIQFQWQALKEFAVSRDRNRRLVPDITIETDTHRFLVEIESSTKTQRIVARKIDQYADLFSPLKSAADKPAYYLKYRDTRKPVVVFVFESEQRAANARVHFERRAADQSLRIPSWRCGTVDSMAATLRADLFGETAPLPLPVFGREQVALLKRFVRESADAIVKVQKAYDAQAVIDRPRLPPTFKAVVEFLDSPTAT